MICKSTFGQSNLEQHPRAPIGQIAFRQEALDDNPTEVRILCCLRSEGHNVAARPGGAGVSPHMCPGPRLRPGIRRPSIGSSLTIKVLSPNLATSKFLVLQGQGAVLNYQGFFIFAVTPRF